MYSIDAYGDELYHHGVLGMKWGVRRYQNEDGSYTSEGKKHKKEKKKSRFSAAEKANIGLGLGLSAAGFGTAAVAANRLRQLSRPRLNGSIHVPSTSTPVTPKMLPAPSQSIVKVGSTPISKVNRSSNSISQFNSIMKTSGGSSILDALNSPYVKAGAAAVAAVGVGAYAYSRYKKNKSKEN